MAAPTSAIRRFFSRAFESLAAPKKSEVQAVKNEVVVSIPSLHPRGKQPEYDLRLYIDEGYRHCVVAHACISVLATAASEPEFVVRTKGKDPRVLEDHPIADLINSPNPQESMKELMERLFVDCNAAGVAYIHKGRNSSGQVIRLQRLRPDWVFPVPGDNINEILHYEFRPGNGARDQIIEYADVIRVVLPDPLDDHAGLSPLMVASNFINIHKESAKYLQDYFLNGAVPAGFIVMKSGPVEKSERERVMAEFIDTYGRGSSGSRDTGNWHRWGVIGGDVDFKQLSPDLEKLNLDEVWGIAESNICSAFRVPAVLVQAKIGLQRNTYSSHSEARKSLWEDTLPPQFNRFCAALNRGLVISETGEDIEIALLFDKVSALQESEEIRITRASSKYTAGLISRNAARMLLGDPALDEDYIVIPPGAVKVDEKGVAVPPESPEPGTITPGGQLVPHIPPKPGSQEAIDHMTAMAEAQQKIASAAATKRVSEKKAEPADKEENRERAGEDRISLAAATFRLGATQDRGDAERHGITNTDPRAQEVSRRIIEAFRDAESSVDIPGLEAAFASGDVSRVIAILDNPEIRSAYETSLSEVISRLVETAGFSEYLPTKIKHEAHGEASGHPFRGNQYTAGKSGAFGSNDSISAYAGTPMKWDLSGASDETVSTMAKQAREYTSRVAKLHGVPVTVKSADISPDHKAIIEAQLHSGIMTMSVLGRDFMRKDGWQVSVDQDTIDAKKMSAAGSITILAYTNNDKKVVMLGHDAVMAGTSPDKADHLFSDMAVNRPVPRVAQQVFQHELGHVEVRALQNKILELRLDGDESGASGVSAAFSDLRHALDSEGGPTTYVNSMIPAKHSVQLSSPMMAWRSGESMIGGVASAVPLHLNEAFAELRGIVEGGLWGSGKPLEHITATHPKCVAAYAAIRAALGRAAKMKTGPAKVYTQGGIPPKIKPSVLGYGNREIFGAD